MPTITQALDADVAKVADGTPGVLANHGARTHFRFETEGVPSSSLRVLQIDGHEGLTEDYRYTVNLAGDRGLDVAKLLGQNGRLRVDWDREVRTIHGRIVAALDLGPLVADRAEEYQLVLASPLAVLTLNTRSRVFLNCNVEAILAEVLSQGGLAADSFRFELKADYPSREYTVQFNETDFNFATRLIQHWGLFYSFDQGPDGAVLVIRDDVAALPGISGHGKLAYRPATGSVEIDEAVTVFQAVHGLRTRSVTLKDYNYRTPEAALHTESSIGGNASSLGTEYRYGDHHQTLDDAELLIKRRQEAIDWRRDVYLAKTTCRGLTAGRVVNLVDLPGQGEDGNYLIVSVTHTGDQTQSHAFGPGRPKSSGKLTYQNEVTLIKHGVPYRPPVETTRLPKAWGLFTARIESSGGDYAYLDDQGRYRVKHLYDTADTNAGEASHPIRLMSSYAGADYGFHFPLHAGTEVVVGCLNGDVNRPIILGAAPNPDTPSPVTSQNNTQNRLRTFGGNELRMEDLQGQEQIALHTQDQKNLFSLDATQDAHVVSLKTDEGRMELSAAKTLTVDSGDSLTVQTGNDQDITVENQHTLQTKNQDIQFTAGTDILHTAQNSIKLNAETQNLELSADQDLIIEAGENMSIRVAERDMDVVAESGALSIEAAQAIAVLGQGGGAITLNQGGGTVEISTRGDIAINAPTINIEGTTVNIKGMQVGNN